jgi:hypothetical protein
VDTGGSGGNGGANYKEICWGFLAGFYEGNVEFVGSQSSTGVAYAKMDSEHCGQDVIRVQKKPSLRMAFFILQTILHKNH